MSRVLVLAGGSPHAHDFAACGEALRNILSASGHDVTVVADPDDAARRLSEGYHALVIDGLWWRMLGEAYDRWRPDYAYTPSESTRKALADYVERGGAVVAMHTTMICFDDWPEWGDILGGSWRWGVSSHPPVGPVHATVIADHPITEAVAAGLTESRTLELIDEVYGDLDLRGGIEVLMTARRTPEDADQPVMWTHRYGRGRIVYDGFGHDAASIRDPGHRAVLERAVAWVLEEV
jgi:type 1 glutamine amidotransferase